jgi:hypothetical protein
MIFLAMNIADHTFSFQETGRAPGEIGPIRLKRDNIGKGKERVEIFLDAENARP